MPCKHKCTYVHSLTNNSTNLTNNIHTREMHLQNATGTKQSSNFFSPINAIRNKNVCFTKI